MLSVRKLYFSLCLLLIVLIFATFVISVDFGGDEADDHLQLTSPNDVERAIENNEPGVISVDDGFEMDGLNLPEGARFDPPNSFTTTEGNPIIGSDGNRYAGNGIQIENGQVINANDFKLETSEGSAEGTNAQNMEFDGPDYSIGFAEFWQTSTHTIFNGHNIMQQGREF